MSAFDMGEAVRPSGLIKTARWTLLLAGVVYGYKRYNTLLKQEDEIRAYNARMKPIWDKEKADKLAKINRENMLQLAKEVGVKVDPKETELLHKDRLTDALSEKYSVKDFRYDDKTETITAKISAR